MDFQFNNIFLIISLFVLVFCIIHTIITDFKSLIISNKTVVSIIFLYFIGSLVNPDVENNFYYILLSSFFTFLFFFIFFVLGFVGGGDVKLVTAISLWLGPSLLFEFLLYMSLAGGILALVKVSLLRMKNNRMLKILGENTHNFFNSKEIPYGLAIGFSALIMIPAIYNNHI
jgi:prepilin peptidase CpaA